MLYRFGIFLCQVLLAILRVDRKASGFENIPKDGGAVLAITHFGYLEFALAASAIWKYDRRRVLFLITAGAFRNPVVGFLLRRLGQIPVDRHAGAGAYAASEAALESGALIGIFPEGGIDPSFTVRELKTGAVRLAAEADVPLVPIALWGGQRLLTRERKGHFFERFGVPVRVVAGPPLPPEVVAGEPHQATAVLRADLRELLSTLRAEYPDDGAGQWWHPRELGGAAPTPDEAVKLNDAVVARRDAKLAARGARGARGAK